MIKSLFIAFIICFSGRSFATECKALFSSANESQTAGPAGKIYLNTYNINFRDVGSYNEYLQVLDRSLEVLTTTPITRSKIKISDDIERVFSGKRDKILERLANVVEDRKKASGEILFTFEELNYLTHRLLMDFSFFDSNFQPLLLKIVAKTEQPPLTQSPRMTESLLEAVYLRVRGDAEDFTNNAIRDRFTEAVLRNARRFSESPGF